MKFINTHLKGNLQKLASETGINKTYLSNILAGRKVPNAKTAQALYFATQVPMEIWFFDYRGNPFINKLRRENKKRKEGRKTKPLE